MPHLSNLESEYKNNIMVLGVDVYEKRRASTQKLKAFIDSACHNLDFSLATEDSDFMVLNWLEASEASDVGIPRCYVINGDGRIAWIGNPHELDTILPKLINNVWDINEAKSHRSALRRLDSLDQEVQYKLAKYRANPLKPDDIGLPDSSLFVLNQIIQGQPSLKFMPHTSAYTFSALLRVNSNRALEFGLAMLEASNYENDLNIIVVGNIKTFSKAGNLTPELYQLGVKAYETEIEYYPETIDIPAAYNYIADWSWRANDRPKAIEAEQKAINSLKSKKVYPRAIMTEFESRLELYKKMERAN